MRKMRSLTLPKVSTAQGDDDCAMSDAGGLPYHLAQGLSRSWSGSDVSSPVTSTFSHRSHSRWPSSSSSIATTPDSPVSHAKSALHDLVEEPIERDDLSCYDKETCDAQELVCICMLLIGLHQHPMLIIIGDTPFCEHSPTRVTGSPVSSPTNRVWTVADDGVIGDDLFSTPATKRRRSGEVFAEKTFSRLSRRWPSISQRWRDKRPTTSISSTYVRSAPPSRSSSVRESLATHLDTRDAYDSSTARTTVAPRNPSMSGQNSPSLPLEILIPEPEEDPVDREELASTPLLPPIMTDLQIPAPAEVQSPLQSPSVAAHSAAASIINAPTTTPAMHGMPTPPLSTKPSMASINGVRPYHAYSTSDVPAMSISEEPDMWSLRLGHADFHIKPKPYLPDVCDRTSCNRLLDDWEAARIEYMRQAAHISEHYGPTSRTYKLTEEKWAEIDAIWRSNLQQANAEAEARGEAPALQALAETQLPSRVPSLNDPQKPAKFPTLEGGIVGPMVQYEKIHQQPSKKPAFLRLFTDPASLLGRSASGLRS